MNNKHCLSEQDLVLHYYQEFSESSAETLHLANCPECEERLNALSREMADLPDLPGVIDPHAATRMAARVSEQLKRPRKKWLPAIGTTAIASVVLALAITLWSPQQELLQTSSIISGPLADNLDGEMSDIDFLEDLELLKELELLSQIEGV
ncbi:hypothetical protein P9J64_13400 [Deltaproteobacteria bacterium IMCC39524]|nr:hypothetical protein [Deltaproteobacteria bacterium IMCC39524]